MGWPRTPVRVSGPASGHHPPAWPWVSGDVGTVFTGRVGNGEGLLALALLLVGTVHGPGLGFPDSKTACFPVRLSTGGTHCGARPLAYWCTETPTSSPESPHPPLCSGKHLASIWVPGV